MSMQASGAAAMVTLSLLFSGGNAWAQTPDLPALDCVINPHKVYDLGSGVRGIIEKVTVERSDFVEADQVVAELDAGVEKASLAVAKARADITSEMLLSEITLDFDTRRKERIHNLYKNKSISIQNKEDAELEAELSAQRLKEAAEREQIRKLELWRAEERLEQKYVRALGSGFVLKKFKSAGEYVEDQPIVRIAQLDKLNVEVIAPMDLFGDIRVGMVADVYTETEELEAHRARVSIVDRMGDVASGTFGVRLTLPNEDYAIPAGVKCRLQFAAEQPLDSESTPAERIASEPEADASQALDRNKPSFAQVDTQAESSANGIAE